MGSLLRRRRRPHPPLPTLSALILLLSASAISLPHFGSSRVAAAAAAAARQETTADDRTRMGVGGGRGSGTDQLRQALRGLGSSPPTCRSKCGQCLPCRPVHVPFHPGFSSPLEYYPEAWRCKCGNKLFMP